MTGKIQAFDNARLTALMSNKPGSLIQSIRIRLIAWPNELVSLNLEFCSPLSIAPSPDYSYNSTASNQANNFPIINRIV
jgi:hypothetical protein